MALYRVVTPAELADAPRDASAWREFEMQLIFFETALVSITWDGRVHISLFDGSMIDRAQKPDAVLLLSCERETAEALTQSLGSVLKTQTTQSDSEK